MHKRMIKDATDEQVREFLTDAISMIKETNYDLYETLENALYKELYGCHFNDWMLEKATSSLINEDGTTGAHWTLEQTNNVAKQLGINFMNYNEYDWNYVMNMIYSDYYGAVTNDTNVYAKMARKFIEDKEAKKKKAGGFVEGQTELLLIFEYNRNKNGKKSADTRLEELYSDVQKLPVDKSFANVWMYEHYNDKKYLDDLLNNLSDQYYDQNITYLLLKEVGKKNIPKDKLEILTTMFEWNKEFIGPEAFTLSEMDQEIEKMLYSEEKSAKK